MRLAVKVSDEMSEKIDHYSSSFGMSKSAFIAYCVGSHIRLLEQQDGITNSIKNAVNERLDDALYAQEEDVQEEQYSE